MSKLNNISAIKSMLDGTHRLQTKQTIQFSSAASKVLQPKRAVGDVWTDEQGIEWEQRDGFKIKKGKMDEIRHLAASNRVPNNCPKCNKVMNNKLDAKFWKLEKHCFDCQVSFEHELRTEGKYESYEKDRILRNAQYWLAEAEAESKELVAAFRNPLTFSGADGTFEKWSGGMTGDEIADKIEKEFKEFKENFISKLTTATNNEAVV